MARVKGLLGSGWNVDLAGKHAFGEGAASFIL